MQGRKCREMKAVLHFNGHCGLLLLGLRIRLSRSAEWETQSGCGIPEGKGSSRRTPFHHPWRQRVLSQKDLPQYLLGAKCFVSLVMSPTVGLLRVNHCARSVSSPDRVRLETVLEVPMNHIALYCQFFRQLFLVIVQQVGIGYDDNGDRNS